MLWTFPRSAEALLLLATLTQAETLAVMNARIWTGVAQRPWAEALAVEGARITIVGSNTEVRARVGPQTRVVDARGRLVTPGFHDAHIHFLTGGHRLSSVQLRTAKSKEEFVRRLADFARTRPKGEWITGGDWDHENWGGELPTRHWIDAVTRDHPVWINRLDGHMGLANTRALQVAGFDKWPQQVPGGAILRDARGRPTGILKDNAMVLVARHVPPPTPEQNRRALEAATDYVLEHGITSIHHMGSWEDLAVFEEAWRRGRLRLRVYAAVPLAGWKRLAERIQKQGRGDEWLRVGMLKGFVDGSLGSHTAAFLDGYHDAPGDRGLLVNTPEDLSEWTAGATAGGLQVAVHAIGDRAVRLQLDIFERVLRQQKPADARFRIEHAQHITPADIPRFARLGVIASMQPYHCIDDGRWAERLIGPERAKTTYAFRSLLDTGATLAFGSDWYVAPATPLEGIYAAVTRRTLDGKHPLGWVPEQKITVDEALRAYTWGASYAEFEERRKGTLEAGKLADLVMLEDDITRMQPENIAKARIAMTVVGGRVAYARRSE